MQVLFFSVVGLEGRDREVQATAESVIATEFATVLGDREGPLVSTAEHVLAALRGMGVDNATIEIDGPEVPIMDGQRDCLRRGNRPGRHPDPVRVAPLPPDFKSRYKSSWAIRSANCGPHAAGFRAELEIDFANPVIGRQSYSLDLTPGTVSVARSAAPRHLRLYERWSRGSGAPVFALGSSFENTVVFDETRLLNTEGLRYSDECAPATRCWM